MAKKHLYYEEAFNLYVHQQFTLREIAKRLPLGEKTLYRWKKEGQWEEKRAEILRKKMLLHEELYDFSRQLMESIRKDLEAGKKVDPGRMYAFARILPLIERVKRYEDEVIQEKGEGKDKPVTIDDLRKLFKQIAAEEIN